MSAQPLPVVTTNPLSIHLFCEAQSSSTMILLSRRKSRRQSPTGLRAVQTRVLCELLRCLAQQKSFVSRQNVQVTLHGVARYNDRALRTQKDYEYATWLSYESSMLTLPRPFVLGLKQSILVGITNDSNMLQENMYLLFSLTKRNMLKKAPSQVHF